MTEREFVDKLKGAGWKPHSMLRSTYVKDAVDILVTNTRAMTSVTGTWVPFEDVLTELKIPYVKHVLIAIGCIGDKRVYIDVPREVAIKRFIESERREPDDGEIQAIEVGDEFWAYDVHGRAL